jgi:hypothetical protein
MVWAGTFRAKLIGDCRFRHVIKLTDRIQALAAM